MKIEKVKNEDIEKFEDLDMGEAFYLLSRLPSDLYIKTYNFKCAEAFGRPALECVRAEFQL